MFDAAFLYETTMVVDTAHNIWGATDSFESVRGRG